jgi:ribosomal protein L35
MKGTGNKIKDRAASKRFRRTGESDDKIHKFNQHHAQVPLLINKATSQEHNITSQETSQEHSQHSQTFSTNIHNPSPSISYSKTALD